MEWKFNRADYRRPPVQLEHMDVRLAFFEDRVEGTGRLHCRAREAVREVLLDCDGEKVPYALDREYASLGKISVDYAVMEKARNLVAARGDFGWDDVGAWPSAGDHLPHDGTGNAVHGRVETLAAKGGVFVNAQPGHLLAVLGAEDLVVVHTADATPVCTRDAAPGLKPLVKQIAAARDGARFV